MNLPMPRGLSYYDPVKNWQKLKQHVEAPDLRAVLNRDFDRFTRGSWHKRFPAEGRYYPNDWESCDWQCDRRGRPPAYWRYVKHAACHWLVNYNLGLAQRVSNRPWRIIRSDRHSTVWDGDRTLFDLNFHALQVSVKETWQLTGRHPTAEMLPPGKQIRCYLAGGFVRDD